MDYDVKLIIDGVEVYEAQKRLSNDEGVEYNAPFISDISLKSSTSLNTLEIGSTASDQLSFSIMNPWKSLDGSTAELWIHTDEDDSENELQVIEDSVGTEEEFEAIDETESNEIEEDDEEGEILTPEEEAESIVEEAEMVEDTFYQLEGEADTIVDVETDESEEPEWIRIGIYNVNSEVTTGSQSVCKALDNVSRLIGIYEPPSTDTSLQACYNALKTQVYLDYGIILDEEDFTDTVYNINLNWSFSCTYREALGYMAGLVGGYVTAGEDGSIGISFYTYSDTILLESQLISIQEDSSGEKLIGGIVCDKSVYKQEYTLESGVGQSIEFSNPFVTQEILDEILNRYVGIRVVGGRIEVPWKHTLTSGNLIRIMTDEEYANYVALTNALAETTDAEEVLSIKDSMNNLGRVMMITNQNINLNGNATSVIDSLVSSEMQLQVLQKSPTIQKILEAGKTATNFISEDNTGALIISNDENNTNLRLDSESLQIRNDNEEIGSFKGDQIVLAKGRAVIDVSEDEQDNTIITTYTSHAPSDKYSTTKLTQVNEYVTNATTLETIGTDEFTDMVTSHATLSSDCREGRYAPVGKEENSHALFDATLDYDKIDDSYIASSCVMRAEYEDESQYNQAQIFAGASREGYSFVNIESDVTNIRSDTTLEGNLTITDGLLKSMFRTVNYTDSSVAIPKSTSKILTATVTYQAGWYPLCIGQYNFSNSSSGSGVSTLGVYRVSLTGRGNNTGTVTFKVTNPNTTAMSLNLDLQIVWVKANFSSGGDKTFNVTVS